MKPLLLLAAAVIAVQAQPAFFGRELLGRPTNTSITVNVAPVNAMDLYLEYGTATGNYASRTPTVSTAANTPVHVLIDKLQPDTRYFYRLRYRDAGAATFLEGPERFFRTARPRGSTYSFAIQFDPHMDENSDENVYRLTLRNMLADQPDFLLDLGDTFMSDKLQPVTQNGVHDRVKLMRTFYDLVGHSVPLILNLGNHEGEWGRNLNGTPNNVAVWNTLLRKQYFPNPRPDGSFYTGDDGVEPIVGAREAWFAWEWGDALFVVLDPYWNRPVAPELQGDWSLTLGRAQYNWLKKTLETSTAKFKFVFAHNLIGGRDLIGPMRGGIEQAKFLEWGGHNLDGTWGFDRARPGWPMPIHQLLVANNVNAFFHGHDHLYAKQDLDGIVYLEGPQPSARNFNLGTRAIDYGYVNGTTLGGTGYLRVTVSPTETKAEYVQTWLPTQENATRRNGMVADTWTVKPKANGLRLLSAASYAGGVLAPASIAGAYGEALASGAPVMVKDSRGAERRAEVLGAAATQVNFVVPAETAQGPTQVSIGSQTGDTLVSATAPGLFAINANGTGPAAAVAQRVRADGSQATEFTFECGPAAGSCSNRPLDLGPASDQVYLSLYGTGLRNDSDPIVATIAGERVEVLYAGPQPAIAGLDQVNVRIPRSMIGRGEVPITFVSGGRVSNTVTIQIR